MLQYVKTEPGVTPFTSSGSLAASFHTHLLLDHIMPNTTALYLFNVGVHGRIIVLLLVLQLSLLLKLQQPLLAHPRSPDLFSQAACKGGQGIRSEEQAQL